jgi:hypothetical protein
LGDINIGVRCPKIIWRPTLFPIGLLDEILITISSLFLLKYDFPALYTVRLLEGLRDTKKFLQSHCVFYVHRSPLESVKDLLKIANTIAYQKTILKVPNPVEVLIVRPRTIKFCRKIEFSLVTLSL